MSIEGNDAQWRRLNGLDTDELEHMRNRALDSPHAHLVFERAEKNEEGQDCLCDFTVRTLWDAPPESSRANVRPLDEATVHWDDFVAVTNDINILSYLAATRAAVPGFPVAGDRPACYLPAKGGGLRVGVVNAGGPAPGLCMVNDSITKRHHAVASRQGQEYKVEVFGYIGGYRGLRDAPKNPKSKYRLIPSRTMQTADSDDKPNDFVTDDHARDRGTFLKSSRFDLRGKVEELDDEDLRSPEIANKYKDGNLLNVDLVVESIRKEELDILYVCGGDGSLRGAQEIKRRAEEAHVRPKGHELIVICGPKTMDANISYTDVTFGATTTVDHLADTTVTFHTTAECQDRIGIMQVFGADSGYVALYASYCSGEVDFVLLPEEVERMGMQERFGEEAPEVINRARFVGSKTALAEKSVDIGEIYKLGLDKSTELAVARTKERLDKNDHALIVIAEGAISNFVHGGDKKKQFGVFLDRFKEALKGTKSEKYTVTDMEPRYQIRENPPQTYDIALCKFIGKAMVDAALSGYTDCMVARWCGQHALIPLHLATRLSNRVDPRDYFYRTMVEKYKLK